MGILANTEGWHTFWTRPFWDGSGSVGALELSVVGLGLSRAVRYPKSPREKAGLSSGPSESGETVNVWRETRVIGWLLGSPP